MIICLDKNPTNLGEQQLGRHRKEPVPEASQRVVTLNRTKDPKWFETATVAQAVFRGIFCLLCTLQQTCSYAELCVDKTFLCICYVHMFPVEEFHHWGEKSCFHCGLHGVWSDGRKYFDGSVTMLKSTPPSSSRHCPPPPLPPHLACHLFHCLHGLFIKCQIPPLLFFLSSPLALSVLSFFC